MYNNYTGDTVDDLFFKLDKLYSDYDNIVVMGHSYPDLDCYGASLAIYKRIVNLGKDCYIYLEGNDYSEIMSKAISSVEDVKYANSSKIGNLSNMLLIIVDVHQVNRLENSNMIDWLLSPNISSGLTAYTLGNTGYVGHYNFVNIARAIRPVLYLKPNVKIKSGNGSIDSPYEFEL